MSSQVRLLDPTDEALNKLVKLRKEKSPHLVPNKQGVVAELIMTALKREVKK